jgi:valyl-tRNA synthetase
MRARTIIAEEQLNKPTLVTTDASLAAAADLVTRLGRVGELKLVEQGTGFYLGAAIPAWLEASAEQVAARHHRLEAQHDEKGKYAASLEAKLANANFVAHAPEAVIADTRAKLKETNGLIKKLEQQLNSLV